MISRIKVVEDVAAPATVIAVDQILQSVAPEWNEWASYGMTAIGYICGLLGFGGVYAKNIGVASAPLTARYIRERIAGGVSGRGRTPLVLRPVHASRGPIGQTTVPELEGVRVS